MAAGDDALAAGMSILTGTELANTLDTIINGVLDEIARRTSAVMPVPKGGTGATSAAGALSNLGLPAKVVENNSSGANGIKLRWESSRIKARIDSTNVGDLAYTSDIPDISGRVAKSGDTMTGDLYLPASSSATSGWTAAYINGDGRVCRGASSLRYKENVTEVSPSAFGNIFPPLNRFQMRGGDGRWTFGHIAETLAENPDTEPFVMYDAEGRPDSVDYVPLLLAKVEQLNARVAELEAERAV